jgi:uncharacterized protein YfkK (UPF0435 family)
MIDENINATTLYCEHPLKGYPQGGVFITTDIFEPLYDLQITKDGKINKTIFNTSHEIINNINYDGVLRFTNGEHKFTALYQNGLLKGINYGDIETWLNTNSTYEDIVTLFSYIKNHQGLSVNEIQNCLKKHEAKK